MEENNTPVKRRAGLLGWIDRRTGVDALLRVSLEEPIPGGARLAYVFGSGLIFIFISQIITGLCLALYYVPSAQNAHVSVAYITKQAVAGAFLRSLHYYGSSAMVIVLGLHFLQTFLYGSFKGRRELLWISGGVLSLLVLGMAFTGYLLPWDQKAYFATAVGTNLVAQVPLIGGWLARLLRGGDTMGTLTLSHFYVAHVFLIPAAIFAFIGGHILLFRKAGPAGPIKEDPIHPKLPPESFYPRQVVMDLAFALLLVVALGILAMVRPALLGPIANPAVASYLPRPEWYYLPMFEWLKFWEGPAAVVGIVVVPAALALLFFLLPFLDRSLERRPWRRPIPLLSVAFVLFGIFFLGFKSHWDDMHDPTLRRQLRLQSQEEEEYAKQPFHPFVQSPGSANFIQPASVNPLIVHGKALYGANGCAACHGENGAGAIAPSLIGITQKMPTPQLEADLRHPIPAMRAGGMPAADLSAPDMAALIAYLGALGTPSAQVSPDTASLSSAVQTANSAPAPLPVSLPVPRATAQSPVKNVSGAAAEPPATSVSPGPSTVPLADAASIAQGRQIFQSHACFACHGAGGVGTPRGRALAGWAAHVPDARLVQLMTDPAPAARAKGMAPVTLAPDEMSALAAYLKSLRAPARPVTVTAAATPASAPSAPEETAPAPPQEAAPGATAQQPTATPAISAAPPAPPASSAPVRAAAASGTAVDAAALAGRKVYASHGCLACHGPNGQGTRIGGPLTRIQEKYSDPALEAVLRAPDKKMKAGGMPPAALKPGEMQNLIAYLHSIQAGIEQPAVAAAPMAGPPSSSAGQPTQPPPPPQAQTAAQRPAAPLTPEALHGRRIYVADRCSSCHGDGGAQGTAVASSLAVTAATLPTPLLEKLLRHPSEQMQTRGMPPVNLNDRDMRALMAYIHSLAPPAQ